MAENGPKNPDNVSESHERVAVWRQTHGYERLGPCGSGHFDDVHELAATTVRDDFENAGLMTGVRDGDRGYVGTHVFARLHGVGNQEDCLLRRCREAMARLSPEQEAIVLVYVIEELRRLNPVSDGYAIAQLRAALGKLAGFYGLRRRERGRPVSSSAGEDPAE